MYLYCLCPGGIMEAGNVMQGLFYTRVTPISFWEGLWGQYSLLTPYWAVRILSVPYISAPDSPKNRPAWLVLHRRVVKTIQEPHSKVLLSVHMCPQYRELKKHWRSEALLRLVMRETKLFKTESMSDCLKSHALVTSAVWDAVSATKMPFTNQLQVLC